MFSSLRALAKKGDIWPEVLLAFGIFVSLRILSWGISPFPLFESLIGLSLVALTTVLFLVKKEYGYMAVFGELILGGSGHVFEIFGLSLRTVLLVVALGHMLFTKELVAWKHVSQHTRYILGALFVWLGFASVFGMMNGHGVRAVYQDVLPFLYLLFIPTFITWWHDARLKQLIGRVLVGALFGHALFSALALGLFSTGAALIHDPWYKWIRDVLMGKVTDMGNGFFRIVLPDHLLVVPAVLGVAIAWVKEKIKTVPAIGIGFLLLFILAVNFSRTYYIALFVSAITLWGIHHAKRSVIQTTKIVVGGFLMFILVNIVVSQGQSTGLELISSRFGGIIKPNTEESAYTRKALLTPIKEKIIDHPLIGNGFGETITIQTDATTTALTTRQFDWGWFELVAEIGIFGVLIIATLFLHLKKVLYKKRNETAPFARAGLATLLFLGVSTLFMPALFHVYGILLLSVVIAYRETLRV
jgi:hypothetical protein